MSGSEARHRGAGILLVWLVLSILPVAAAAQSSPCAAEEVCKQSTAPPAEDWFRHGLEALAEGDCVAATCALDRATELAPEEDGHNLTGFVKPMLAGVRPLPRNCTQSSAPLDRKKYFPRLYLAKAYFELALRAAEAAKGEFCSNGLRSLAESRAKAPQARVQQQIERREKVEKALKDSRCCELLPEEAVCAAK